MPFQVISPPENADVQHFVARVDTLFEPAAPETFWKCSEAFDEVARSQAASDVSIEALGQMMDDPLAAPLGWAMQRLVIVQNASYSLVLTWTGRPTEPEDHTLTTQGGHAFIHSKSSSPFRVRHFSVGAVDFSRFDPDRKLEFSHEVTVRPGETIAVDGGKWVLEIEDRPDICMLVFVSKPLWPHMWSFDAQTLRPWSVGHSELRDSQLRAVLQIFRELGYSQSETVVRELIEHPVHDVRWEAMKTLFQLNSGASIAELERATHDSHPHVRNAAKKSLLTFAQRPSTATEVSR